jgi:hypothetical protein
MARSPALTLLDVIQAVSEVATNEQETLATIVHLLTSGQVRLSDEGFQEHLPENVRLGEMRD